MNDSSRPKYDFILCGATGFTGSLTARFLESQKLSNWAISGRNRSRLETLQSERAPSADIVVVDSSDYLAVRNLVSDTKVILSAAGPFAQIGTPLVRACVELGRDYVDITGEIQWMRTIIDQYERSAQTTGSRIVHTCGFDSVPSDLGVMLLRDAFVDDGIPPDTPVEILGLVTKLRGGLSGGTLASMNGALQAAKEPEIAQLLRNPYSLNSSLENLPKAPRDQYSAAFVPEINCWTAPFIMAAVNTRVVRRSDVLRGYKPGDLSYHEATKAKSMWAARRYAVLFKAAFLSQSIDLIRVLTSPFLPKPGEGPSESARRRGAFELTFFGRIQGRPNFTHKVTVAAPLDPGYDATAIMLAESAQSLLETPRTAGGVLTPSAAFGRRLVSRLEAHQFSFKVEQISALT